MSFSVSVWSKTIRVSLARCRAASGKHFLSCVLSSCRSSLLSVSPSQTNPRWLTHWLILLSCVSGPRISCQIAISLGLLIYRFGTHCQVSIPNSETSFMDRVAGGGKRPGKTDKKSGNGPSQKAKRRAVGTGAKATPTR